MFDFIHDIDIIRPGMRDPLRSFVSEQRDALLNAAALLGGRGGTRLAQTVLEGLANEAEPSRRVMRALDDLLDLLMLEHVHDQDREESARFAAINLFDPSIEDICLLADGLSDALAAFRESANAERTAV